MTDQMYARIREIADEHDGKLAVTISPFDLAVPIIAHPRPRSRVAPEVYMTEADLDDFRARIRAEGLRPQRQSAVQADELFPTGTPFPSTIWR